MWVYLFYFVSPRVIPYSASEFCSFSSYGYLCFKLWKNVDDEGNGKSFPHFTFPKFRDEHDDDDEDDDDDDHYEEENHEENDEGDDDEIDEEDDDEIDEEVEADRDDDDDFDHDEEEEIHDDDDDDYWTLYVRIWTK